VAHEIKLRSILWVSENFDYEQMENEGQGGTAYLKIGCQQY